MTVSFKPHVLCCGGLLIASGVLFVKSRVPENTAPSLPATSAPLVATGGSVPSTTSYPLAQIGQWVAPVALYPDNLLSQILMASTCPNNVELAEQWSKTNPSMQGDATVRAVFGQPWDPSVKSLVAFPALLALMSENNQWVRDLGNAFLTQPQDFTSEVQKLRAMAQQTGMLKSTPQQTVTTVSSTGAPHLCKQQTGTAVKSSSPAASVIKIESADLCVPTYNPAAVYGT